MNKEILICVENGIHKRKLYHTKNPTLIDDADFDKIWYVASFLLIKKGYKYCIGYNDDVIKLSHCV